jgi:hypothetical protein
LVKLTVWGLIGTSLLPCKNHRIEIRDLDSSHLSPHPSFRSLASPFHHLRGTPKLTTSHRLRKKTRICVPDKSNPLGRTVDWPFPGLAKPASSRITYTIPRFGEMQRNSNYATR